MIRAGAREGDAAARRAARAVGQRNAERRIDGVDEREALAAFTDNACEREIGAFLDHEAGYSGAAVMARNAEAMQCGALLSGEASH